MVCDFCSSPSPTWAYPAHTFTHDPNPESPWLNQSVGGWAACNVCHDLIALGDWDGLAIRSYQTLIADVPEMAVADRCGVLRHLRLLHNQFREARTGPPTRIDN